MFGRSHKQNEELHKVKTRHSKYYNNEKSIVNNSTENVKVKLGNKNKYESKKPKKFHVKKTRRRTLRGRLKQFSKLLNEAYNPNEPWLKTDNPWFITNQLQNDNGDDKLISYYFDDIDSIKEVIDSFTSFKKKDYVINKLSNYEQAQLFRMLLFVYLKIKDISDNFRRLSDEEISEKYKDLSTDDIISFEYITEETYKTIGDTLEKLAGKLKDTREGKHTKSKNDKNAAAEFANNIYNYNEYDSDLQHFKNYMGLNKLVPEPDKREKNKLKINTKEISEFYEKYKQNNLKQDDTSTEEMKEYANYIKGILSETFVPRCSGYSFNGGDGEIMDLRPSYKLIVDKELVKKLGEENQSGKLDSYMKKSQFRTLLTPEERVKLIRGYKQMKEEDAKKEIYETSGDDKTSAKEKEEEKKRDDKIEAITFDPDYKRKPNITYIKSGVIKNSNGNFTLQEIGQDIKGNDKLGDAPVFEAHTESIATGNKIKMATHCFIRFRATEYNPDYGEKYKRKVYSVGFYPVSTGTGNVNTTVKETSTFGKFANLVTKKNSKRGLIVDDRDRFSRLAITRKCNNERIKKLDNCIHNFASRERYNLALNNCTTFVSKISKDIGFRDISKLFGSFVICSPSLASRKLVHAILSNKYMEDKATNFKTYDFEDNDIGNHSVRDYISAFGITFFKDMCEDALSNKFRNGKRIPNDKKVNEFRDYFETAINGFDRLLYLNSPNYKKELEETLTKMRKLREISRKQKNMFVFFLSKGYIDRINMELERLQQNEEAKVSE